MITMEQVKALRKKTGAGVVEAKKALDEAAGDEKRAVEILRERGQAKALKKTDRTAGEGLIGSYVHGNGKLGAMVKLYCETDFVARNSDFQALARDLAMHVAASAPTCLRPEDAPAEALESERRLWREELASQGKPEQMHEQILAGKEKKWREAQALLTQPFVKDPEKTVEAVVTEAISRIGENIKIGGFVRVEL